MLVKSVRVGERFWIVVLEGVNSVGWGAGDCERLSRAVDIIGGNTIYCAGRYEHQWRTRPAVLVTILFCLLARRS